MSAGACFAIADPQREGRKKGGFVAQCDRTIIAASSSVSMGDGEEGTGFGQAAVKNQPSDSGVDH
jgi:hypothetical protein